MDDIADATLAAFIALFNILITEALAAWFGALIGTKSKSNVYYYCAQTVLNETNRTKIN